MATAEAHKISTVLRHPRSRVRLNPHWIAPSVPLTSTHGHFRVSVSRNRITRHMWARIAPHTPPAESEGYFLVQLTARCSVDDISTSPADLSRDISALFRSIVGAFWHVIDDFNPQESNGDLRWNWYALMTQEDLATTIPQGARAA